MSLFIATGSNIGNKKLNLDLAKAKLQENFELLDSSQIYSSQAIDYTDQDDFFNQVLEFKTPKLSPAEIMKKLLELELFLGRKRDIKQGPRVIDLDILFIDDLNIQTELLQVPHPRLFSRSFVVLPLSELSGFKELQKHFSFTFDFTNSATPIPI